MMPVKKAASKSKAASAVKKSGVKKAAPSKPEAEKKNPGQANLDAKLAAEAAAAKAEEDKKAEQAARWKPELKLWRASMTELTLAMNAAEAEGKTPLLLDHTEQKAVDTFFHYSSHNPQVIEGKKLIMQGRDAAGLAEVMEESRGLLVRAMARGYTLYLRMTNCAADVIGKYQDPKALPIEVWDRLIVNQVRDEDLCDHEEHPLRAVVTEDDCAEYSSVNYFGVHKEFRVVICSHFSEEDYGEFLERALPMEKLQAICITGED